MQCRAQPHGEGPAVNNTTRKPNDVVTVAELRERLEKGWELHIVCRSDAELRGPQWHGSWYFIGVDPNSLDWVPLVTTRDQKKARAKLSESSEPALTHEIEFREVRTASGVIKLLKELGLSGVGLPTDAGKSVVLRPRTN